MPALRRILPIALALAIAAGPVAPAAVAGPVVRCTDHLELVQKMRDQVWYAVVRLRNLRPHAATVSGGWEVHVRGRITTFHRHADLLPGERQRFWVIVQMRHVDNAPTIELQSCR